MNWSTRLANQLWYGGNPFYRLLLPLSWLFALISACRRYLYARGVLRAEYVGVPVIVVGNISVGGVGKTPVVIDLVKRLQAQGWRPGVVSRGYGGSAKGVHSVTPSSDPGLVGDEPVLIAARTGCAVAVAAQRTAAARLLTTQGVNVIVADDGLQHYALGRDFEIVVIDGERRFGNRALLPAGPLRERPARAQQADLLLVTGAGDFALEPNEYRLQGQLGKARNLLSGEERSLNQFSEVCALAGIGKPEKFFSALEAAGLKIQRFAFADHHRFRPQDLQLPGQHAILMTEKDAVKCERFKNSRAWAVDYEVCLPNAAWQIIQTHLGRPPKGSRQGSTHG